MNLEKISLVLFIKYMRQFQSIKVHMAASLRELLLAMSSTIEIVNLISQDSIIFRNLTPLKTSFYKIDNLLSYTIKQLETKPNSDENSPQISQQVIQSLLETLDDEIEKINEGIEDNKDLKIEALATVKAVVTGFRQKHQKLMDFDDISSFERAANAS